MTNPNLAEQVKAKLALEEESRNAKIQALKSLDTKALIDQIIKTEKDLDAALRDELTFKDLNAGLLSSAGSDCAKVKHILAELHNSPRESKMTANDVAAFLTLQRTQNKELSEAIEAQRSTAFQLGNLQLNIESLRRRLDGLHGVLYLRTAQVKFLTETNN